MNWPRVSPLRIRVYRPGKLAHLPLARGADTSTFRNTQSDRVFPRDVPLIYT